MTNITPDDDSKPDEAPNPDGLKFRSFADGQIAEWAAKARAVGIALAPLLVVNLVETSQRRLTQALAGTLDKTEREQLELALEMFASFQPWAENWLSNCLKLTGARDEAQTALWRAQVQKLVYRYIQPGVGAEEHTSQPKDE